MAEKRKSKPFVILIIVLTIIGILLGCYFITKGFVNTYLGKPDLMILQPKAPLALSLGDGLQVITLANSTNSIQRVEFYVNNQLIDKQIPANSKANEMVSYFSWLPQSIGVYDLSFFAYDDNDRASDKASIPIAVISSNLPEAEVDQIKQEIQSAPILNVVSDAMDDRVENQIDQNLEGEDPEGGNDENQEGGPFVVEGFDWNEGIVVVIDGEQQEQRNIPPAIGMFETQLGRDGTDGSVEVNIWAEDDLGLSSIETKVFSVGAQALLDSQSTLCNGELTCMSAVQFSLTEGVYLITGQAIDLQGISSSIVTREVEIISNNQVEEPAALVEDILEQLIPGDIVENAFIDQFGRIQISDLQAGFPEGQQFEEIDPEVRCPPYCPNSDFEDIVLTVEQFWNRNRMLSAQITMMIPPGISADNMENAYISATEIGSQRTAGAVGLTEEVYQNGATVSGNLTILSDCGGQAIYYAPRLYGDFQLQTEGERVTIQSLPCPPDRVQLTQLHATTSCGGAEKCIVVDWSISGSESNSYPIDHLVLKKKYFEIGGDQEREYILSTDQTSFLDTEVFPNRMFEYTIYSVSSEGIASQPSRLNMRTPINPWELISTDWQESR